MQTNRSMPPVAIIPELAYDDVGEAVAWLCDRFGFTERLRIANHRAQLNVFGGAMVVMQRVAPRGTGRSHGLMVRVPNVDAHHDHAKARGARIVDPPATHPYGERQYTAEDLGGHFWTFSETVLDVDPQSWGGEMKE